MSSLKKIIMDLENESRIDTAPPRTSVCPRCGQASIHVTTSYDSLIGIDFYIFKCIACDITWKQDPLSWHDEPDQLDVVNVFKEEQMIDRRNKMPDKTKVEELWDAIISTGRINREMELLLSEVKSGSIPDKTAAQPDCSPVVSLSSVLENGPTILRETMDLYAKNMKELRELLLS